MTTCQTPADTAPALVFVNYRGSDAASAAALLHVRLTERLGPGAAFLDYESIELGRDFDPVLLAGVRNAAVLLAVIGDRWLPGDHGATPLHNPDDWVRREILEAFAHDVPVVPVLVNPAAAIDENQLPDELRRLARLQRFEIRTRRQRRDIDVLIDSLVEQIPRLRDRPVRGLTPWQAFVAAIHTNRQRPDTQATITLAVDHDGHIGQLTLQRERPRDTDQLLRIDHRLVDDLAHAAGLRADDNAIQTAEDWLERQAHTGHRDLHRDTVAHAAAELGIRTGPARTVLSVATLKPDPLARDADHALDWVDRFDGDSPYLKRRPLAPATWNDLQTDIEDIPNHLNAGGAEVLVTGSMRLATAFAVGATLRMVTSADVAISQRGQLWSSTTPYAAPLEPKTTERAIGRGGELAVAVAVATDPTDDVIAYLHEAHLPVDRLLVLTPPRGPHDNAIPDPATAAALATGIRNAVRPQSRKHDRIHLYLACPLGLALLLGHRWNRVRTTHVYEDVNTALVYEHAFTIAA